jgi:hypothetical protein
VSTLPTAGQNLADNALLPKIDVDVPLAGGGRLTVMAFLSPAEGTVVEDVTRRWEAGSAEDPVGAVRLEAERLSEKAADAIPLGWCRPQPVQHHARRVGAGQAG